MHCPCGRAPTGTEGPLWGEGAPLPPVTLPREPPPPVASMHYETKPYYVELSLELRIN